MFKLKPQKNSQDGSFLLVIECGTESSSMSIKVLLGSPRSPFFFAAAGILTVGPSVHLSGAVVSPVLCCPGSVRDSRAKLALGRLVALE